MGFDQLYRLYLQGVITYAEYLREVGAIFHSFAPYVDHFELRKAAESWLSRVDQLDAALELYRQFPNENTARIVYLAVARGASG